MCGFARQSAPVPDKRIAKYKLDFQARARANVYHTFDWRRWSVPPARSPAASSEITVLTRPVSLARRRSPLGTLQRTAQAARRTDTTRSPGSSDSTACSTAATSSGICSPSACASTGKRRILTKPTVFKHDNACLSCSPTRRKYQEADLACDPARKSPGLDLRSRSSEFRAEPEHNARLADEIEGVRVRLAFSADIHGCGCDAGRERERNGLCGGNPESTP